MEKLSTLLVEKKLAYQYVINLYFFRKLMSALVGLVISYKNRKIICGDRGYMKAIDFDTGETYFQEKVPCSIAPYRKTVDRL